MAFVMHLGCTSKGLVDYPWSACRSAGAATPLNLAAESRRRFFEDFAQFITGTPSLTYIWPCLGACYANIALTLSDSTRPPGDAVPACLTVQVSASGTRSASRTPRSAQTSTSSSDFSRALPAFPSESTRRPSWLVCIFIGRSHAHVSFAQPAHMHVDPSAHPTDRPCCFCRPVLLLPG